MMNREAVISLWSSIACHAVVLSGLHFARGQVTAQSSQSGHAEIPVAFTIVEVQPSILEEAPAIVPAPPPPPAPPQVVATPTASYLPAPQNASRSPEPSVVAEPSTVGGTPTIAAAVTPRPEETPASAPPSTNTVARVDEPVVVSSNSPSGDPSSTSLAQSSNSRKPQVLAQPNYRRNPAPTYPISAKRRHQEGVVLLHVRVKPDGRPAEVVVQKPSGISTLDQAAVESVKGWDFIPAQLDARPVESEIEVPVRFQLVK